MKFIFCLFTASIFCLISFGQTTFYSSSSGNWSDPHSWDKQRLPASNDIIVIQSSHTIKLDRDLKLSNVTIRVFGNLEMAGKRSFELNNNSIINILTGGRLVSPDKSVHAVITLGNIVKYRGNKEYVQGWDKGIVKGMAYASGSSGDIDQQGRGFVIGNLPAIWQDFTLVRTADSHIQMVWVTSHETGLRIFEIEKSNNGFNWSKIGSIQSEGNISSSQNIYSFVDEDPGSGNIFYRVKHIYPDNKIVFSAVRLIKMDPEQTAATLYPNPATHLATIRFGKNLKENGHLSLYNSNGQAIKHIPVAKDSRSVVMDVSSLSAGVYIMNISEPGAVNRLLHLVKL